MKNRMLTGIAFALSFVFVLAPDTAVAQKGKGKPQPNPRVRWEFVNASGDRIMSDGGSYEGALFAGGSEDATMPSGKNRWVQFDFGDKVPDSGQSPNWMAGTVPLEAAFNVHRLGTIRPSAANAPFTNADGTVTMTTWMTNQMAGPDHKTYKLEMRPDVVDTGEPPTVEGANSPYLTSPVTATFYPQGACEVGPCGTNPYGMWVVTGYNFTGETPPRLQVGTIFMLANTWIEVGQFSLPFKVTITALDPLPEVQ